jgi:hypothetical protein
MTRAREIFGTWSAPDGSSAEGRLIVDDAGRITLELRRPLPESARLRGVLGDGSPATLFSLALLRLDPGAEHYVCEHLVGAALLGLDLPDRELSPLVQGEAHIAGLAEVIGVSGLSIETSDITRRTDLFARVEWKGSDALEVALPGGSLVLADHARFDHESYFRFALEHRVLARYNASAPIGLERLEEIFDVLCCFVSFSVEARVSFESLTVTAVPEQSGKRAASDVAERLIHHRPHYGGPLADAKPWLTLAALSDPAAALAGFYRFHKRQSSAYLILFEYLIFTAQLNPIDKLLYLARFLEVYHRTRFGPDTMAFHRRVVELLGGPAALTSPILGATPDEFAELLRDCRNYWTHYDPKIAERALHDITLDEFDDRVLLVVRACLLDDIGVPPGEAKPRLESDWRWQRRAGSPIERPE